MTTTTAASVWERRINNAVRWILRHWLLIANVLVLLYGGIPWLSPLAHMAGYHQLGDTLFLIYTALCHQKPEQSFFWNGYQVAFCERETAMYTALLAGGLLFATIRDRVRPVPIRVGLLLLLPMLLDGGTQLIDDVSGLNIRGLNDTVGSFNFWTRMITGLLFAVAVVITVYPRLQRELSRSDLVV